MTQEDLKLIKQEVLKMGEQTRGYVFAEFTSAGQIVWRFGGNVIDGIFLTHYLGRMLDKEFDRMNSGTVQ